MAHSRVARIVIGLLCIYTFAAFYTFDTQGIDPFVRILWCVVLFLLLNRAVRYFENRRGRNREVP